MTFHNSNLSKSQRRWLVPLALWLVAALWLICFRHDLGHLALGPAALDLAELITQETSSAQYVTLSGPEIQYAIPYLYTQGKEPYARHAVLQNGDTLLLLCIPNGHTGTSYTGMLEPLSAYEKEHLVPRMLERAAAKRMFPYRLNMVRPVLPIICWLTLVPVIFCCAAAVWLTWLEFTL